MSSANQKLKIHESKVGQPYSTQNSMNQIVTQSSVNKSSMFNKDSLIKKASFVNSAFNEQPLIQTRRLKVLSKSPQQKDNCNNNGSSLPQIRTRNEEKVAQSFFQKRKSNDIMSCVNDAIMNCLTEENDIIAHGGSNRLRSSSFEKKQDALTNTIVLPKYSNDNIFNERDKSKPISKCYPKVNASQAKIILKNSQSDTIETEVSLDKKWLRQKIPHIANVLSDVKDNEGVEITINCNVDAFKWIINYLQQDDSSILETINNYNCLHLLVSSNFLGLKSLYETIWKLYMQEYFVDIINACDMNLKNLNKNIMKDIAERIDEKQYQLINERGDKLLSQLYRSKVELLTSQYQLHYCKVCKKIMTEQQTEIISCISEQNRNGDDEQEELQYINVHGSLQRIHDLERAIDSNKLVMYYREKQRICWKEIYMKLLALVQDPQYCQKCNEWFRMNELGTCREHQSKPNMKADTNKASYICCLKNEKAFSGCSYQSNTGCQFDFHLMDDSDPLVCEQKINYLITSEQDQSQSQSIQNKYSSTIQFTKPQSFNYQITLSQVYQDLIQEQQSLQQQILQQTPTTQNTNDDLLFRVPEAQKLFSQLQDSKFRDNISKEAKEIVRSRSPGASNSNQLRLQLDSERNGMSVSIRKRSLSPQQMKEIQKIARQRMGECKQDIIRDDDKKSIKILSQLLKQQRVDEGYSKFTSKSQAANKEPHQQFFIDINQISNKSGRQQPIDSQMSVILSTKRSNNSQERRKRKKSPLLQIKQNQIQRKCSPI